MALAAVRFDAHFPRDFGSRFLPSQRQEVWDEQQQKTLSKTTTGEPLSAQGTVDFPNWLASLEQRFPWFQNRATVELKQFKQILVSGLRRDWRRLSNRWLSFCGPECMVSSVLRYLMASGDAVIDHQMPRSGGRQGRQLVSRV